LPSVLLFSSIVVFERVLRISLRLTWQIVVG
jgi:hypothetical protein